MKQAPQRQSVIKGVKRERLSAAVIQKTRNALELTKKRFNVRGSFVIAVALAYYFGIEEQEQFEVKPQRMRRAG